MTITTPREMFDRELQKLYHAEVEILELHGDLSEAATSDEISDLFAGHKADTVTQINRIETVFELLEQEPRERGSALMEGLIAEKDEFISEVENDALRDVDALGIGTINERIEITLLDRLLFLAEELELPPAVGDHLEQNRAEAASALENMRTLASERRLD